MPMPQTLRYSEPPSTALRKMPGRYGSRLGFVYAIICARRVVKIGSSVHPRFRIGEQCFDGQLCHWGLQDDRNVRVKELILSGAHRRFREFENTLHAILHPFRIGHHNSEKYLLSRRGLNDLQELFAKPLTAARIQAFSKNGVRP